MQIPESVIDPAAAEPDVFRYLVVARDDDWSSWDDVPRSAKYLGARKAATGQWNLREVDGAPVQWGMRDDEIVIIDVLGNGN